LTADYPAIQKLKNVTTITHN